MALSEIDTVFSGLVKLGIKQELIESSKLTAIAKSIPQLALACVEGKRLLSAQMTVPEVPISPTELGKAITQKLGLVKVITAQQVNQALANAQITPILIDPAQITPISPLIPPDARTITGAGSSSIANFPAIVHPVLVGFGRSS